MSGPNVIRGDEELIARTLALLSVTRDAASLREIARRLLEMAEEKERGEA